MKCCKKAYRAANKYCSLFRCPCLEESCRFYGEMTKADRIRAMDDEELAKYLVEAGWDCHLCKEHYRLDNEPLLRGERCDEECAKHCLEWLRKRVEA